jgi:hypothetical protein
VSLQVAHVFICCTAPSCPLDDAIDVVGQHH